MYICARKKTFLIIKIRKVLFILLLKYRVRTGNYSATEIISFLLYEPQFLQTLCGTINSPHLLHLTNAGADIFQLALLLSLLPLEDLFFGQIDMVYTSLN